MGRKTDALRLLLAAYAPTSSMVFCNTRAMVDQLTEELQKHGFRAAGLHGDMKQAQRTQVMNSFKNKATDILVATDVAARGIDVSGIDVVFNYDLPQDNEYYIHRIGRTGRAGRTGTAYTLISGRRQFYELREVAKYINAEITELPLPDKEGIIAMKKEATVKSIAELQSSHNAYDVIDRLASMGIDYREAAARLITKELEADLDSIPEFDRPRPLKNRKGQNAKTVKVDINIGRNRRIAPNFILGALVDATGMSGRDFGKIDIFDDHTTVEVPAAETDYILESTNPMKINGQQVTVKIWDGSSSQKGHFSRPRPDNKPAFDRKKKAYNGRNKKEIFSDYIPDRKKRSKKRH
jgi:ATP-dependent RNA helicase DeaD